jgi:peptidyl-tRNA hydrolase, PTH1 family
MWVVVGLGNPGVEYAQTRHNVGFMVIETVARRHGIALRDRDARLRLGRGRVENQSVTLVQPQTFMNCSGEALAELPLEPSDALMVVYDDLDLPAGQLRVRPRGGSGGHRGVASIVEHFGAEFARVRVGIGRPPQGFDAVDYVLASLLPADLEPFRADVERASDAVECVVTHGVDVGMQRFNARALPDVP